MEFRIHADEEGLSALEILKRRLPAAPQGYLRRLLRGGRVRREGVSLEEASCVAAGESLRLPRSARVSELLNASSMNPEILYESREILALFKPSGLAVHRGVGHEGDNLLLRVQSLIKRRGAPFRTAPVHRLDAETSGPVLFAKGRHAAGELGKIFMTDAVEKTYWGLASGRFESAGSLTTPVHAKGKMKPALTDFTPMGTCSGFTLLEMRLRSGRTHQIRRQLAEAGHPLAGDARYRGPHIPGLERLFLHCGRLHFVNPFDGTPVTIDSPLPTELAETLQSLGLSPLCGT